MKRCFLLIIDSLGVGEAPDAKEYGDEGTNTLGNVGKAVGPLNLPTMEKLGFGKITEVNGLKRINESTVGRLSEISVGNDSTTGHWELAGLITETDFQIYENGFPEELISKIENETNYKFIGNRHASGTQIIEELGEKHLNSGEIILYTSGDSVFQIAAHEDVLSIEELYELCEVSRKHCNSYNIGRVIARPFKGKAGSFERTYDRKDYGIEPPGETILSHLRKNNFTTYGIGKIMDLFGTEYLSSFVHTEGDLDGLERLKKEINSGNHDFTFVNLVDLDMVYGHREDPEGYYKGLQLIDKHLETILNELKDDDLLIISGDHGTDPTDGKTDHSREYVPLIAFKKESQKVYLGDLHGFTNVASTISEYFGIENVFPGTSFLNQI